MARKSVLARRDRDGLAHVGRTLFDLRGIRFEEGEEGNIPADETDAPDTVDHSACIAKVDALTAKLDEKDVAMANLAVELTAAKAANYDLLMQVPGSESTDDDVQVDDSDADVDVDDLFGKDDD